MPVESPFDISQLMEQLRSDAERILKNCPTTFKSAQSLAQMATDNLTRPDNEPEGELGLPRKDTYHYREFLPYEGRAFIRNLYVCLLRRDPGTQEIDEWLHVMRFKGLSKVESVATFSLSLEGRAQQVKLLGLGRTRRLLHRLMRLRVIGYPLRLLVALFNLPFAERDRFHQAIVFEQARRHEISILKENISVAKRVLSEMQTAVSNTAGNVAQTAGEILTLKKSSINSGLELSILKSALTEATHKATATATDYATLQTHYANLQSAFIHIKEKNLHIVNDITCIQDNITHAFEKISNVTDNFNDFKNDIVETNHVVSNLSAEISNTNATVANITNNISGISNTILNTTNGISLVTSSLSSVTNDVLHLRHSVTSMQNDVAGTSGTLSELTSTVTTLGDTTQHLAEDHSAALVSLKVVAASQQTTLDTQQNLLAAVREEIHTHLEGHAISRQLPYIEDELFHLDDLAYVAFEDNFRGSREEIKQRLEVYLPYLELAVAGQANAPLLDIGCGRGEWLEVCRDHGLTASGVDINATMAGHCGALGLSVHLGDALAYVQGLADQSLGAITAFHLVEHLGFPALRMLLQECLRVLRPGGIVLFETPNPENLIVGACNFYIDPSHVRPIPPVTLDFILKNKGFVTTEILRLHPLGLFACPQDAPTYLRYMSDMFNGPLDYCAIGRKG